MNMGVKEDSGNRRYVEVSVCVPGTPEEVWEAVATGPGISCWFVPTDIEPHEGGAMCFHLGENMDAAGRVTGWSPPHRMTYEEVDWMEGAPPLATEVTVTSDGGGTCTVRMVHSLFTSNEDWDNQLESMEGGWPSFFQVLRLYMESYRGEPCVSLSFNGGFDGAVAEAMPFLKSKLGFSGGEAQAPLTFMPVPGSPLQAVDLSKGYVHGDRDLLVRLADPEHGIVLVSVGEWNGGVILSLQLFFYGAEAANAAKGKNEQWRNWFGAHFTSAPGASC